MATEMAEVSNRVNFGSWVGRLTCPEKSGQREYPMISGLVRKKRYGIQCPENIGPASTWYTWPYHLSRQHRRTNCTFLFHRRSLEAWCWSFSLAISLLISMKPIWKVNIAPTSHCNLSHTDHSSDKSKLVVCWMLCPVKTLLLFDHYRDRNSMIMLSDHDSPTTRLPGRPTIANHGPCQSCYIRFRFRFGDTFRLPTNNWSFHVHFFGKGVNNDCMINGIPRY